MKFAEIPSKLHSLLMPPDPIVINHIITVEGPDARKTACYDIDVEVVSCFYGCIEFSDIQIVHFQYNQ